MQGWGTGALPAARPGAWFCDYEDAELWPAALQAARRLVELPEMHTFRLYTPSYVYYHCAARIRYKGGCEAPLDLNQVGRAGAGGGWRALTGQRLRLKPVVPDSQ